MGLQQHWSLTPGNNQTADSGVNLREGQAPSTMNDAVRQIVARLKAAMLDMSGALVTAGTGTAYTLATNEGFTALVDGTVLGFRAHATSGATPTLNVDGVGAVAMQIAPGVAVPTGALLSGHRYAATYYAAGTAWLISDTPLPATITALSALLASAGTLLTVQRTENDAVEREILSMLSGSGAGNKGSRRIVGDAANGVAELREYIGATEIWRLTTALALSQIAFGVGASLRFNPSGFADLTEIAAPANPVANTLRAYALDVGGTTRLALKDSTGVETVIYPGELVAIIEDRKSQGTDGAILSDSPNNVRQLNTLAFNRNSLVSLSSDRFTLPAGTWEIEWWAGIGGTQPRCSTSVISLQPDRRCRGRQGHVGLLPDGRERPRRAAPQRGQRGCDNRG